MIWLRNKVNTKLQQLSGDTLRNINSASFLGCMLFLIIQSVFLIKLTQNDISLNFNSPAHYWIALVASCLMTSLLYYLKKKTETLLNDLNNENNLKTITKS
jgi:hypothetical protein